MSKLKSIRDQLIAAGEVVSDNDLIIAALVGLPREYAIIRTFILARESYISLKEFRAQLLNTERDIECMEHTLSTSMAAMYVQGASSQTHIEHGSSSNSHSADGLSSATVGTIRPGSFYPTLIAQTSSHLHVPSVQPHPLPMPPPVQFSPYGYGYGFVGTSEFGFSAGNSSQGSMSMSSQSTYIPYNGQHQRGNGNFRSNFNKGRGSNFGSRQGQWNGNTDSRFHMQHECQICQRRGHTAPNCFYRSPSSSSTVTTCQICGKRGHIALECYHRGNYAFQGQAPSSAFNNMP